MALPVLTPVSETPATILPETGSLSIASDSASYPYGVYVSNTDFISGALDQVNYTYRKLGGDVLDIELTEKNVYAAYEEAVLEYSYLVNIHQAKNTLGSALGATTGTFDHDGEHKSDSPMASMPNVALNYPKFEFGYVKQISDKTATEVGIGGTDPIYSGSFNTVPGKQDYDLQTILSASATNSSSSFYNKIGNKRVTIRRVFYKTPHSMWRFYGYYGGINAIGNLSTYGMYADDSTYEVIPPWQNKLQAMAYEDAIYTRNSHYSYEIKNNNIRIFPRPGTYTQRKFWVEFTVKSDPWEEAGSTETGTDGVNNMNTLPFANIPYENINSIGKQWIRRFALALIKEMLGQVRGKFATIPIPGDNVTLNHSELLNQAKEEKEKLREELKTVLDEMTYSKIEQTQAEMVKAANEILMTIPYGVYVG